MVYVYINDLPWQIRKNITHTEDALNPQNYMEFKAVEQLIRVFNENHVDSDHLFLHQIVGQKFLMDSDIQALQIKWDEDHRPADVLKEIREREIRCQDRNFIANSNKYSKGMFKVEKKENMKDYEKSINFGLSFIFSIFASALVGYYFGLYGLQLPQDQCYILAILFLMGALFLETSLYIIKIMKDDQVVKMKEKQAQKQTTSAKREYKGKNKVE